MRDVNFAQRMRLIWIDWALERGGLNRAMIAEAFGMSIQQASNDIAIYQKNWPHRIEYDHRAREYRRLMGARPAFPLYLRADVAATVAKVRHDMDRENHPGWV